MAPKLPVATTAKVFDVSAPKKPTNVSVNGDLLREARELDINLSQALEERRIGRILRGPIRSRILVKRSS